MRKTGKSISLIESRFYKSACVIKSIKEDLNHVAKMPLFDDSELTFPSFHFGARLFCLWSRYDRINLATIRSFYRLELEDVTPTKRSVSFDQRCSDKVEEIYMDVKLLKEAAKLKRGVDLSGVTFSRWKIESPFSSSNFQQSENLQVTNNCTVGREGNGLLEWSWCGLGLVQIQDWSHLYGFESRPVLTFRPRLKWSGPAVGSVLTKLTFLEKNASFVLKIHKTVQKWLQHKDFAWGGSFSVISKIHAVVNQNQWLTGMIPCFVPEF